MSLPRTEQTPDDLKRLSPARRRRAQRLLLPLSADEREAFLDDIAHRTSPSIDFYLFSLLAGLIIALGLWLDAPALLVLGALFAPTMTPLVGIALGTISGSMRFFGRSLIGLLTASLLVFVTSLSVGFMASYWKPFEFTQAYLHTQLAWHHFVVLAVGSILTTVAIVRTRRRAAVASVALAYELYVPLAAAGVGLGSGVPHLWPDGLVVFSIHLAWAAILGTLTLLILGFRPLTIFGYTAGGVLTIVGIILLIGLGGAGAAVGGQVALPTLTPSDTPPPTETLTPSPTGTASITPIPPTVTLPATLTASITVPPSDTPVPSPTPVYAIVSAPEEYNGAILRDGPSFANTAITSILNGTLIEILSEIPTQTDNVAWLNVKLPDGPEGWMLQSAITIATPVPNW
ncbi:MAG: DUF389 domain-containing protein [Anaerolineales bacterium]|nr:DUF389 domain-containing protein [Chloroflexota bacterium]MBL6980279.1 DUF389 domain-containing protein [Anaerolineales bacterium]